MFNPNDYSEAGTISSGDVGEKTDPLDNILSGAGASVDTSSFYKAGDSHNLSNGDFAFTEQSTWESGLGNAGKFIVASAYSGLNAFYNTGVAIGNFFGADLAENDTAQGLANIDTNLGQYYQDHQQAVDAVGFIAGSFLPGLAGVKLLNVGQKMLGVAVKSGRIGGNFAKAVGLLQPEAVGNLATQAGKEMAATQATFSNINATVVKALASGYGQSVLETAAFQTAATAASFKSPTLSDASAGAIVHDVILSSLEFGGLGLAFSGAKVFKAVRREVKAGDILEKPYTQTTQLPEGMSASDRIIAAAEDKENTPLVAAVAPADAAPEMVRKLERLKEERTTKLGNEARSNAHTLAGNDKQLGNQFADILTGMSAKEVEASIAGSEQIGRLGTRLDAEKEIAKAGKKGLLQVAGASLNKTIQYVKLWGEDAGSIVTDAPATASLADSIATPDQIKSAIADMGFSVKKLWNPIEEVTGISAKEAEGRYWWADNIAKISDGMKVHEWDIPLQERILKEMQDSTSGIKSVTLDSTRTGAYEITNSDDLLRSLRNSKGEVANHLQASAAAGNPIDIDAIARITNTRLSWLKGERNTLNESSDIFARQSFSAEYNQKLLKNGVRGVSSPLVDTTFLPQWMKVAINHDPITDVTGHVLTGMAYLQAKSALVRTGVDNVVGKAFGDLIARFPAIPPEILKFANRFGAGPKAFTFANGTYGSIESLMEYLGSSTAVVLKKFRDTVEAGLQGPLTRLAASQDASVEYELVKNLVHSTAEHYRLSEDGMFLIHRGTQDYETALSTGQKNLTKPVLQEGAPERIPLKNAETQDTIAVEIGLNRFNVQTKRELLAAQGKESHWDEGTWYPNRPNPQDYKYFAIVVDAKATGGSVGQKSMLHAATPDALEKMIDKVNSLGDRYQIITKADSKAYHEAVGDFDYDKTLHENYIDADLKKSGVNNQFFLQTNPQKIINDIQSFHARNSDILARELVNAKYEPEFKTLRDFGRSYTNVATSTYTGSSFRYAEEAVNNPYINYIKTALNLKQSANYKTWTGLNQLADQVYSKAHYAITDAFNAAKTTADLEGVNAALKKYGIRSAYYDTATALLVNHPAPKDALGRFVRGANSILSTLTLGLDPLNALNNGVGANVLLGSETQNLLKNIRKNPDLAGKLSGLLDSQLPGVQDTIRNPGKLIASVYQDFFKESSLSSVKSGVPLTPRDEFFIHNGWIPKDFGQIRAINSGMELEGSETVKDLNSKLQKTFDTAKKFSEIGYQKTGNRYVEYMNRWVAARTMQKLTDLAESGGILRPEESLSYINSFVNRTQGNFLASQRPISFQGPIGNAIGLFQTYQFNLMQQMFRYVSEGSAKDAGMLLGLQSTLYGLNGLPAFNFINTHIVGTMSSNPRHNDLYKSIYGAVGSSIGDFVTYGLPSDLIQTNLYSRGDINPRQATVLPTSLDDIPIVNATGNFLGNLKTTAAKLNDGGNTWETILQGIEHNGLSRPLAGLAQIAQETAVGSVVSTSKQGTIMGANDLFTLASISRLAGGRPIDEAIINDAAYRTSAYKAVDTERKKTLDAAVKTSVLNGSTPSDSQQATFAARYAELGGDTKRFNQYMLKQITSANTLQAEQIMKGLKTPYAQSMQRIMGGRDLYDE